MKRILFILLLAVLSGAPVLGALTYDQAYYARQKAYLGGGNFNDPLWNFWGELEGYLGAEGTGNTYYVDSNVSVEGDGTSWTNAKNTLDEAVALCTANNGDVIEVAQGHNEALTAADAVDLDVAGITVVGRGTGSDRPRFDFDHADGEFVIGAAGITIRNLTFLPSVTGITHCIDVENGGDWAVIEDCEILEGETAGTDEFTDCIQVGTTATNVTIRYNVYTSIAATTVPNNFVDLSAATISNPMVYGNVVKGRFAEAGIWAGAAVPTDCYIVANTVWNVTASQFCIEFQGAATGICAYNLCHAATADFEIDPGSMERWFNGEGTVFPEQVSIYDVTGAFSGDGGAAQDDSVKASLDLAHTDLDAILADTAAMDTAAELRTLMNAANVEIAGEPNQTTVLTNVAAILVDTAAMDTEAEWADLGSTLVDNIVSAVDSNGVIQGLALSGTPVANSLSTFIATGGTSLGTALAASKSLVDAIGTNGTTVADTATGVAGMIGVDDADNAMSTSSVVSNADGSVYERQEYLQKLQEVLTAEQLRSIAGSSMPLAVWYVDPAAAGTADGKSPANAFTTLTAAITACSNTVDDWVLVYDYSGGGGSLTINKSFVHIIGNACKGMPYPRIKPATALDGIVFTDSGDRVEIANLTIGAGDQTKACIDFNDCAAGAYGVYIHDCVIGRDADAPGLYGIYVPSGNDAPYLYVENNRFYGADGAGIAAAGSAIRIAGNATRCTITGNYIQDIGRTATPAIWLDGAVTNPCITNNQIKTDTDTGTGSAITLGASVDDGWIAGNVACDGKDAPANNPYVDAASTNGWGNNYTGHALTLP